MRLAVLFSGGKDSTFAVHLAKQAGHNVVCLVAMQPKNDASFMYHAPNIDWTKLQAKAMNIPIVVVPTAGKKEEELNDLQSALGKLKKSKKIEGLKNLIEEKESGIKKLKDKISEAYSENKTLAK